MSPLDLFNLCMDAIARFNAGEVFAEMPFVILTLPRAECPRGKTIRLFGKTGPLGNIATVKECPSGGYDVTGYFPAAPIIQALRDVVEADEKVRR